MLLLGFASGLPLALSAGSLQAWLTVSGVDIRTIGLFALAGLPYTFKFIWAPLLDRFEPPLAGRRRGWLAISQLALGAACLLMAQLDPAADIELMGVTALAIAFLSASQDVVFDAYRSDLLGERVVEGGEGGGLPSVPVAFALLPRRREGAQGVDATGLVGARRQLQFRRTAKHRPRVARGRLGGTRGEAQQRRDQQRGPAQT